MSFPIERADPSQVEALCAIERKAVQLFRGHPAWPSYAAVSIPPELLGQAIDRGLVWVAMDEAGKPAGFVWLDADLPGGAIGIAEIDVLPECGRRGIGAALLEHACAWAREAAEATYNGTAGLICPAFRAIGEWAVPSKGRKNFNTEDDGEPRRTTEVDLS